ncbi:MAG: hypothetical protein MUP27_09095 [Desulfobacterales bacterium]|nr:hypothetical protein [Desulfobacterales bacterium]
MKKEELTKELLIGAAKDLNKILGLKPEIVVDFDSTLKGVALKAAREKFEEQVKKDLAESGALIAPTDTLEPKTIDVLEALEVKDIRAKLVSGGTAAPSTAEEPSGKAGKKEVKGKMATKKKTAPAKEKKAPTPKPKTAAKKAAVKAVEKNEFGFRTKTKSDEAIKLIASGKTTLKDIRKKFNMLSFGKLISDLEDHGFRVKESKEGLTSVIKK